MSYKNAVIVALQEYQESCAKLLFAADEIKFLRMPDCDIDTIPETFISRNDKQYIKWLNQWDEYYAMVYEKGTGNRLELYRS